MKPYSLHSARRPRAPLERFLRPAQVIALLAQEREIRAAGHAFGSTPVPELAPLSPRLKRHRALARSRRRRILHDS